MYSYIKGEVVDIKKDHIMLENQGVGYLIYVSNPYSFKKVQQTIYVHLQVKEDAHTLFGFKEQQERDLFLKLILVKGIGCKTAIAMLAIGDIERIIDAIETGNTSFLRKIPGIGPKAAQQIVLDLQGKFKEHTVISKSAVNPELEEASEVLLALGYKKADVDRVVAIMEKQEDIQDYIKTALALLVK